METEKTVYEVGVDTGGSAHRFETYNDDIFYNLRAGNESMIFFTTTDGESVAIPSRFLVTHKKKN